jgi:hypothetical protein
VITIGKAPGEDCAAAVTGRRPKKIPQQKERTEKNFKAAAEGEHSGLVLVAATRQRKQKTSFRRQKKLRPPAIFARRFRGSRNSARDTLFFGTPDQRQIRRLL